MANGYIGKISAVVTANTSDLSRKLQGGIAEVDKFANRLSRSVKAASDSASASFGKIFTPLQRLERSFQGALNLNLRTESDINKLRALVSVAEDINKPLAAAAQSFTGLSRVVAAEFQPALVRAQGQVQFIEKQFEIFGRISESTFNRVTRNVERTTVAINQLREASALVSSLPTGNELAFSDPRLAANLQAAQKAGRQALSLPSSTIASDPQIEGLTRQIARVSELSVAAAARVKAAVTPSELSAAKQEADRLNSVLESLVAKLNKKYAVVIDAQRAIADSTALSARLDELQENATFSITGTPQNLKQVEAELVRILGQFDKLTEAQRQPLGDQFSKVVESLRAGNLPEAIQNFQALEASVKLAANETERLARANKQLTIAPDQPPPPSPSTPLGNRLAQQGAERIRGLTGNLNIDSTPVPGVFNQQAQRDIDALASRVGQVRQQLEALPNSLRTQFVPALQQAQQQLIALQNAPGATVDEIERATLAVQRLEQRASAAKTALDFSARFGGGAGGFARIFQDQALRGFTAQLEILQGVIGRVSADARGPLLVSFSRLRDVIAAAFRSGTLEAEATQAQIRQLTAEVVNSASALAGIGRGTLNRQLARAGDIGRAGFDRFGLAVQQAAFAIDDFFSVTGGLDQRIRAVGNNLTQLGFILGGTAGLFATVALVAGTQAVLGFIKFARGGAESADIAKALNERLETQKNLLREVSAGFAELAGDLADSAFSAATKQADALERRLTSLIDKLREFGDATASTLDPNLFVLEGRRGTLERSLQGADSASLAAARQARLREAERQVAAARSSASARNPIGRQELQDVINASFGEGVDGFRLPDGAGDRQILEILDQRQLELAQVVDSWFATFTTPFQQADARRLIAIVAQARSRLETNVADGLRNLTEGVFRRSVGRFDSASGRAADLLEQARQAGGGSNATRAAQSAGEAETRRFRQLIEQFGAAVSEGRQDEAARAARLIEALSQSAVAREREARAILDAANASARFVEVLGRFGELNDTIFGDISNLAEQARRGAVQAAGTAAAGLSRRDDERFAAGRSTRLQGELRAAEDRRTAINSSILEARRRFNRESPDPRIRRLVEESSRARALADDATASDFARDQARQRALFADQQLQREFESSPQGRDLRAQLDEADRQARVAIERDSLITRGRELSLSDGDRAGRELDENLKAINAAFDEQVRAVRDQDQRRDLGGLAAIAGIEEERRAAVARAREEAFRSAAPAIFGLADAVQNAILQGPSRAALQATDVSSVQGASELNRLLRGDDAARNADLVELQKQSQILERIARGVEDGAAAAVAN